MKPSKALWFTGLSGSGKSTLSIALKNKLEETGYAVKVLDGDEMRKGLNKDLRFSPKDRFENIRRVAEVNKLFLDFGISTINAFISPTDEIREMARLIIGSERFCEVYLTTPLEVCMQRDPKGFYKKIKEGNLKDFTGVDAVFEPSKSARLSINTYQKSIEDCLELILNEFNREQLNISVLTDHAII